MRTQIKNAKPVNNSLGFTMIELMVTLIISTIIISAVGILVADSSGWFSDSYGKINSQPAVETLVARKTFERVIRQSSETGFSVSPDESEVEIHYYSTPSGPLDSYARFHVSGTDLMLEKGSLAPKTALSSETICSDVSSCTFKTAGTAVQMILIVDDGKNKEGSVTSAIMHN